MEEEVSHKMDLLEIHAKDPKFHVLFIPGNPGVISFYLDFLESLYDLLDGTASVTAISHIAQTEKNWERGRLFSLQEQTDHKINFIEHELQDVEVPIVLVGHSIGSYISLDIFKRFQGKVAYCICLYPFLAVNTKSSTQSVIKKIAASRTLSTGLSSIVAILGLLPAWISRILVKNSVGKSWCAAAVEALCSHVLRYHTVQNILYMAMTEFEKLSEVPDWSFMREKKSQMAFLFGVDDHWSPLDLYEEIYCVYDVMLMLDPAMTSILKLFMLYHHFESAAQAVSLALLSSCIVEGCKNQFDEFLGDKF
ncbi:hypothetical protein KY289_004030 [Solanum tuberosum]|nr:hypothetical protein KY289_004030 [Solanum tuberosum]